MNSRIASLENTSEPNIRVRPKHAAYERDDATTSKIHELSPAQQAAGNMAMQRLLRSGAIRAKLIVAPSNDTHEQEANRAAGRVVSGGMPAIGEMQGVRTASAGAVHRRAGEGVAGLATESHPDGLPTDSGRPLSDASRRFAGSAFGANFGHVLLHDSPTARMTAGSLGARAFTHGSHIWLGQDESEQDRRLMSHELAHVMQQTIAPVPMLMRQTPAPAAGVSPPTAPPPTPVPSPESTEDIGFDPAVLVPAGLELESAAALRQLYANGVKAIADEAALMLARGVPAEEVTNWANAARNNLKQQIRDQGPRIIKVLAEARNMRKYGNPLGLTAEQLRAMGKTNEQIIESAGRGNINIARWAGRMRIAGRILIALDIGIAAYQVAMAPEVDRPRVLLEEASAIGGALAGAAAGAKGGGWIGGVIGAWFGGAGAVPGAAIGALIGGIGGAFVGAWGGRKLGGFVADQFYPPAQTGFEGGFQ